MQISKDGTLKNSFLVAEKPPAGKPAAEIPFEEETPYAEIEGWAISEREIYFVRKGQAEDDPCRYKVMSATWSIWNDTRTRHFHIAWGIPTKSRDSFDREIMILDPLPYTRKTPSGEREFPGRLLSVYQFLEEFVPWRWANDSEWQAMLDAVASQIEKDKETEQAAANWRAAEDESRRQMQAFQRNPAQILAEAFKLLRPETGKGK